MKKHSNSTELRVAFSGLARMFRETAELEKYRRADAHGHDDGRAKHPAHHGHANELGARLQKTLADYVRLDHLIRKALDDQAGLPELATTLLATDESWALLREQSKPVELDLLASLLEASQQAYLIRLDLEVAIVPLVGRVTEGRVELQEFVPNAAPASGGTWMTCGPTSASTPDVSQVLQYVGDPTTPVQLELTWIGLETLTVTRVTATPSIAWPGVAYPVGSTGSVRRGTLVDSPLFDPIAGVVDLTMRITAQGKATVTRDSWIRVELGETRRGPVLQPIPIPIRVPNPTPPWLPPDAFTLLEPHRQLELRDAVLDFIRDTLRVYPELARELGPTTPGHTEVIRDAILQLATIDR
jgi:hypothetical protein